jgi:(p)ppGpp synthase/HD superfamily hydrolase
VIDIEQDKEIINRYRKLLNYETCIEETEHKIIKETCSFSTSTQDMRRKSDEPYIYHPSQPKIAR